MDEMHTGSEFIEPAQLKKWPQLLELWKNYFSKVIISNEWYMEPTLLALIGSTVPIRYDDSGIVKYARFHILMMQPPGTGKSATMTLLHRLLDKIETYRTDETKQKIWITPLKTKDPILHAHITDYSDAAVVGSVVKVKGEKGKETNKIQYGHLYDKLLLTWDEGSEIFAQRNYAEKTSSTLQSATDEPGKVYKTLKDGTITYEPKSTIILGSYLSPQLRDVFWNTGFSQRFYVCVHDFSDNDFSRLFDGAGFSIYFKDREELEDEICKFIWEIQLESTPYVVDYYFYQPFFENVLRPYTQKHIQGTFINREKQEILNTYVMRWYDIIKKAAAIIAYVEQAPLIEECHYQEAFRICKNSIEDVKKLLAEKPMKAVDITLQDRFQIIQRIIFQRSIKNPDGVFWTDIWADLEKESKLGNWDHPELYSRDIMDKLWKQGLIKKMKITTSKGKRIAFKLAKGE